MPIAIETCDSRHSKSLQVSADTETREVFYVVTWCTPGKYEKKTFQEGEFAKAVDFYNTVNVTPETGATS